MVKKSTVATTLLSYSGMWRFVKGYSDYSHAWSNYKQSGYDLVSLLFNCPKLHWQIQLSGYNGGVPLNSLERFHPVVAPCQLHQNLQCKTHAISRVGPSETITFCISQLAPSFQ